MHLSMSCPDGGSAGIYRLLTRKCCPCEGKFDFIWPGHPQARPKGRDYWHTWSRWTRCAPKRERKSNIEPRIKLNCYNIKVLRTVALSCRPRFNLTAQYSRSIWFGSKNVFFVETAVKFFNFNFSLHYPFHYAAVDHYSPVWTSFTGSHFQNFSSTSGAQRDLLRLSAKTDRRPSNRRT